jgi:cobalt-zinc-cadmium efflux system outer membrane protein
MTRAGLAIWASVSLAPSAASGQAGGGITLAEARERARAASPRLEGAREAVAAARGEERQAGAFLNPALFYSHEQTWRSGETDREDVALIEQPLEIAGQRKLRQEAARIRREAAEEQLRAAERVLDFDVATAYAEVVAAERKWTHSQEAARAFSRARATSAQRRRQGDVSGYEDLRMALEAARFAAIGADSERERRSARAVLASLLALSPGEAPLLEEPLVGSLDTPVPGMPLAELRDVALAQNPEVRAAELVLLAEQAEARLARREVVPDPTIALGYKRQNVTEESGTWDGFAAAVSIPLPLWDREEGAIEAAEAEARGQAAELRRLRRRVALDVERAWVELQAASAQLDAIGPQLGADAEAALLAARSAYHEGEITLVEWLDTVQAYFEAESIYADLLADHFIRRAALERAVGASLF